MTLIADSFIGGTFLKRAEPNWLTVLKISMPLCLSYIPIGLACGILLHVAGFNFFMTLLVSVVVFSGGAQFLIASLLTINAPIISVVVTLFFLELRYALLGSSLSRYLKGQSQHFIWLFSVSLNDENYAVNYLKFATDKTWTPRQALMVEHYSLISWSVSNLVGSLIGSALTIDLEIVDFALTALFLYMVVMQIRNRLTLLISLLSGVLAIAFMVWTKSTLGLVLSTLVASFIGFMIEAQIRKSKVKLSDHWLFRKVRGPALTRKTIEDKNTDS